MTDEDHIRQLSGKFGEIVKNYKANESWKNIPLAKSAYSIMTVNLADDFTGELTPGGRADLLEKMLDFCNENDMPRFVLEVTKYQLGMLEREPEPDEELRERVILRFNRLTDYVNMEMPMEEFVKKYSRALLFDPVERTPQWEDIVYDVEKEISEKTRSSRKGMGFCFRYWYIKANILERYGIEWHSPAVMNPRVMFD